MPRQWFIKTQNGQHGPISSKRLSRLVRKGTLTPNTGVSCDGETWVKAKKISGLSFNEPKKEANDDRRKKSGGWFIQTKNSVHGPVSSRKLRKLAKKGRIAPNVAVSRDRKHWFKAKRIPGLEFPSRTDSVSQEPSPTPITRVSLPVFEELPFTGPFPSLADLPVRYTLPIPLPVINDLPINGPVPLLSDLPKRKRERVALPVIDELPIDGKLPTITDLPARISFPIALPVVDELPIDGGLPAIADLPPRKRDPVPLPVLQELPVDGRVPTLESWLVAQQAAEHQKLGELRQRQYVRHFGPMATVSRGEVDVCLHPPNSIRPVATLVTCGMSNHEMSVPEGDWSPRAELVMYVDPDKMHANYIELLRNLATVPKKFGRGFWYGSTMSNGSPTKNIFAGSPLDSFVFMIPNIRSDFQIRQSLSIANQPVQLLWVVPITTPERQYLHQYGMKTFCQLLDQNGHNLTLDPNRQCFVTGGQQQVG